MKHIIKNPEPKFLSDWKHNNRGKKYDDFQRNTRLKHQLEEKLLKEQFHLCCYCGINLKDMDHDSEYDKYYHIEHLIPQSSATGRVLTMNYSNMLISCNGIDWIYGDPPDRNYCGHRKGKMFSEEMLTPLDSTCENRLILGGDGNIYPNADSSDQGAEMAIKTMNLNSYVLIEMRKEIVETIIDELELLEDEDEKSYYINDQLNFFCEEVKPYVLPSFSQEVTSFLKSIQ